MKIKKRTSNTHISSQDVSDFIKKSLVFGGGLLALSV